HCVIPCSWTIHYDPDLDGVSKSEFGFIGWLRRHLVRASLFRAWREVRSQFRSRRKSRARGNRTGGRTLGIESLTRLCQESSKKIRYPFAMRAWMAKQTPRIYVPFRQTPI